MTMTITLVDSNVLFDVLQRDPTWYDWSAKAVERAMSSGGVAINPVIYSEVSIGFERMEDFEEVLPPEAFQRLELPWEAAFLAGKCYLRYKRKGGDRRSPLPDFYIGAHAVVSGLHLLTRDATRYRTYFPKLKVTAPS